jgi:prepilin-type N-terminal cleavage/methylation domain-containing protein
MHGSRAFTLIELVVVLFLVGIVALLGVPSFQQALIENEMDRAAAELRGLMRYARSRAVTGAPHSIIFEVGNDRVYVWDEVVKAVIPGQLKKGDCELQFGPGGDFENVRLASADFAGVQTVAFDHLGNADNGGTVVIAVGSLTRTLRVTGPGGRVTID